MADVKKIATRESYGNTLKELAAEGHEDLVVLDADLAAATKTGMFRKAYPDRHFDCGIAEENMMGVAAGCTFPSRFGGVHNTISLQPAIRAGTANINTVENKGAVPPGIYKPTFSIATAFCQQVTPGVVSTFFPSKRCEAWNFSIFAFAVRIACFKSSATKASASRISSSET